MAHSLMDGFVQRYYDSLKSVMDSIFVTNRQGDDLGFANAMVEVARLIQSRATNGNKLMFIGNGASAAISSHMSTDFWKNGRIRSTVFNDSSLLTCIGNDYGFEYLFQEPIKMFADQGDILLAISSSGQSANILKGVAAADAKDCTIVTLSGFQSDNPLRQMGDFNFYAPYTAYGIVEIIHHSICHCILDMIIAS